MSRSSTAAELTKLAGTLGRPAAELDFLSAVPPNDLRVLRGQISRALFEADRGAFEKVAAVARLIPAGIAARVAQAVMPPVLAARVAELLEPDKAVELAARLADSYLSDVAVQLEPARAANIVAPVPADRVAALTRELARRGDWAVIGSFLPYLAPHALRAATAALDGEQLLRSAFVVEDGARLDQITASWTDGQLDQALVAAGARGLWTELDVLLCALGPAAGARFAGRFAAAPARLQAAVDAAVGAGLLSAAARARLAAA